MTAVKRCLEIIFDITMSADAQQPELTDRTIVLRGVKRSYGVATGSPSNGPLLLVFHGLGINGAVMAAWTGLARRGPAAGFITAFPNGVNEFWDDTGLNRADAVDDPAFVTALIDELAGITTRADPEVVLVGLSNGASFVENLARHGLVKARGIALVAGTARVVSRRRAPIPEQRCGVLLIAGTADPNVPYQGGRASGLTGWIARRRMRGRLLHTEGRESVAPERTAADWALANGCGPQPETRPTASGGDLPVEKLVWSCPSGLPVTLYRIVGGGHGWPGGPQYVPRFLIGRISRTFDATGAVLEFAREVIGAG